jgi:hypothetical protein
VTETVRILAVDQIGARLAAVDHYMATKIMPRLAKDAGREVAPLGVVALAMTAVDDYLVELTAGMTPGQAAASQMAADNSKLDVALALVANGDSSAVRAAYAETQ